METVTPVDVNEKDSGWTEIALEDGRSLSTKEQTFIDVLKQAAEEGKEIGVDVNHVKNGKFDNYYVNGVEGVAKPKRSAPTGARGGSRPAAGGGMSKEEWAAKDKRIAAQWAVGRAVELYCADHPAVTGDTDLSKIAALAAQLLETSGKLS